MTERAEIGVNCHHPCFLDGGGNRSQKHFPQANLGERSVDLRKPTQINGLRMSVVRERGLREFKEKFDEKLLVHRGQMHCWFRVPGRNPVDRVDLKRRYVRGGYRLVEGL